MALPALLRDNLSIPVVGAPLFIVSNPDLVIEQCKAGIVGAFPALNARPSGVFDQWLTRIREELQAHDAAHPEAPSAPFAVNLIVHRSNTRLQEEMWEKDLARRQLDDQNEKMLGELTDRSQRATLLAKMGELLQTCLNKDEIFAAALGFAPRVFASSRGAVALLNGERSLVEVNGSWNDCFLPATVFEPNACWALRTGHPHLVVAGDATV